MMKIFKWIIGIIVVFFTVNTIYYFLKQEGMKEYRFNKDLEIIKKDWKGNLAIGGEYTNGVMRKDKQIMPLDILKWKLSKNPQAKEKKEENYKLKVINDNSFISSKEDMIVWLGHASFFIRLNGTTFITDPIFYDITFIKRLAGLPCAISDFKGIDYVLLSHGHRDHFDKKTLKQLFRNNPEIEALIPLDMNDFFEDNNAKYQQAGWYQKYKTKSEIEVYFMPARHWNRRGMLDFNKYLWGSFVIKSNGKSIFFSGDTAYGNHFKEISKYFNEIDYSLMSIAAYMPVNIMKETHMNPDEALKAFEDLNSKVFVPMHYGTYDLSDEPLGEPIRRIESKKEKYNIEILDIGEKLEI